MLLSIKIEYIFLTWKFDFNLETSMIEVKFRKNVQKCIDAADHIEISPKIIYSIWLHGSSTGHLLMKW
jgi:hypothetical protein